MRHVICKLTFDTAARFGSDAGGSRLTGAGMGFRADVLFSALLKALLPLDRAEALLRCVRAGALTFSDALPWRGEALFLPRPVGIFRSADDPASEDPSQRKLLKKIAYIPSEQLNDFMSGRADLQKLHDSSDFGKYYEVTRVNRRDGEQPLPYRVGGFRFNADCGLYLLICCDDEGLSLFETGMRSLSAEGLGGKVSSGWGKFRFEIVPMPDTLTRALEDADAPVQMLLSSALPTEEAMAPALDGAFFTVARRGGFVTTEQRLPLKKRTVYLLGAGSTFRRRFPGVVLDVGVDMPHPVWRYAMPLFMGVRL